MTSSSGVRVTFWGVRGSIPSPGPTTVRYGGNTPCLSVKTPEAHVILDAGSGIRACGQAITKANGSNGHELTLLVSHTHWDHIQGLPFFAPAFVPGNRLTIAGPEIFSPGLERVISDQMRHSYFPLRLGSLSAGFTFRELSPGTYTDLVPGAVVRTVATNHPVVDLAYRIESHGRAVAYLTDHEGWSDEFADSVRRSPDTASRLIEQFVLGDLAQELKEFIRGADLLVADAMYTREEYHARLGWGHSSYDHIYQLAEECGVRCLAFMHHDPNRSDDVLDAIEREFDERNARERRFEHVFMAREGMEIEL